MKNELEGMWKEGVSILSADRLYNGRDLKVALRWPLKAMETVGLTYIRL
jgi:hypothetical protein